MKREVKEIQEVSYNIDKRELQKAVLDYIQDNQADDKQYGIIGDDYSIEFNKDGGATVTSRYVIKG